MALDRTATLFPYEPLTRKLAGSGRVVSMRADPSLSRPIRCKSRAGTWLSRATRPPECRSRQPHHAVALGTRSARVRRGLAFERVLASRSVAERRRATRGRGLRAQIFFSTFLALLGRTADTS